MPIKSDIMHKAVESVLQKANVPARHHLALMKVLEKHIADGNKDRGLWLAVVKKHAKEMADHEMRNKKHDEEHAAQVEDIRAKTNEQIEEYRTEVERLKDIAQGEPGKDGEDGISPKIDHEAIVKIALTHIPMPKTPEGQPLDIKGLVSEVLKALTDAKNPVLTTAHLKDITPFTQRLQSAINQNSQGFMFNGKRYKFEELMHGGGSSTGGGLSGTQEKSTTIPNGVLTTFSFAHTPKVIVWNGAVQALTDDYTVSGNNITFTVSAGIPQTGDKVINIYA